MSDMEMKTPSLYRVQSGSIPRTTVDNTVFSFFHHVVLFINWW